MRETYPERLFFPADQKDSATWQDQVAVYLHLVTKSGQNLASCPS